MSLKAPYDHICNNCQGNYSSHNPYGDFTCYQCQQESENVARLIQERKEDRIYLKNNMETLLGTLILLLIIIDWKNKIGIFRK